ncbi:MAG: hypothetical protein ACM359_07455 [Bacillota bacterium]
MHETQKSILNIEMQQDTTAMPRRYWWMKRIAVGYVLFVAVVGGLYGVSNHLAERRLQVELDKLRARGEPAVLSDLAGPPVPPEQNAAILLKKAGEIDLEDADVLGDIPLRPPLSAGDAATLERILGKWEPGLQLIRLARELPGINWDLNTSNVAELIEMRQLRSQFSLYECVAAAAALAHAKQNDRDSIEYLRDLLMLSRATDQPPLLVAHLRAIGVRGHPISMIDNLVPRLQIARQEAALSDRPGPASPLQVRSLIRELVDDEGFHQALTRAMQGEHVLNVVLIPKWWDNGRWEVPFLRPLLLTDARAHLNWSSRYVEAAREHDWPTARAKLPAVPAAPLQPSQKLAAMTANTQTGTFLSHYRTLVAGRATAIALAQRLYQLDHGRVATRWEELVPGYLPRIPMDPMSQNAMMPLGPTTQAANGK